MIMRGQTMASGAGSTRARVALPHGALEPSSARNRKHSAAVRYDPGGLEMAARSGGVPLLRLI